MIERKKRVKKPTFEEFQTWLSNLGLINPTLHVNGVAHPSAVITVDFGTPLIEQKLEAEQNAELVTRIRNATKSLFPDREINIRVQNDSANGIFWASVG